MICRLPVKHLSKVQNFLWTLQIRPYLGSSTCWGHSVLQTPALVGFGSVVSSTALQSPCFGKQQLIALLYTRHLCRGVYSFRLSVRSWNLCQSFTLQFLQVSISLQSLIRKHSYLDHVYFHKFWPPVIGLNVRNLETLKKCYTAFSFMLTPSKEKRPRGRAVSAPDFGSRSRGFESHWRRDSSRT